MVPVGTTVRAGGCAVLGDVELLGGDVHEITSSRRGVVHRYRVAYRYIRGIHAMNPGLAIPINGRVLDRQYVSHLIAFNPNISIVVNDGIAHGYVLPVAARKPDPVPIIVNE